MKTPCPLFEPLESRQLFAAHLPDLVPSLSYTPPAVLQPGASLSSAVLDISNAGASMTKKTRVSIGLYASPTRTLPANATPFKTLKQPLNLATGKSTSVTLSATLPSSLPKRYFLIARVNDDGAFAESNTKNDTVVSSRLHNPLGTYSGKTSPTLAGRPGGTLSLTLSSNSSPFSFTSSLLADLSLATDGLPTFRLSHLKSNFSSAGLYHLKAHGSLNYPALGGHTAYHLRIHASLSHHNTLTGTLKLHLQSPSNSQNLTNTFTLSRK